MEVRSAIKDDLLSLATLFNSYRVWYKKGSDVDGAKKFLEERMHKQDSEVYVCEDQGQLIGFVQLYPLFSSTRMSKFWLLNDLFVNEDYRGKGVSIKLIDRAKKLVKDSGACGMYLETDKTNFVGNKLYPKTGFQLNETSNFYEWELTNG
ncbi:GNAT family N-acetyltransferase [Ekhidna sp.]